MTDARPEPVSRGTDAPQRGAESERRPVPVAQ